MVNSPPQIISKEKITPALKKNTKLGPNYTLLQLHLPKRISTLDFSMGDIQTSLSTAIKAIALSFTKDAVLKSRI